MSESDITGYCIGGERKWGHIDKVRRMRAHKEGVHRGLNCCRNGEGVRGVAVVGNILP